MLEGTSMSMDTLSRPLFFHDLWDSPVIDGVWIVVARSFLPGYIFKGAFLDFHEAYLYVQRTELDNVSVIFAPFGKEF